jgi:MFS transporter, FHS family, L-fucose permease
MMADDRVGNSLCRCIDNRCAPTSSTLSNKSTLKKNPMSLHTPASASITRPMDELSTGALQLRGFVFVLFFVFGGITSLNDVIIPKLKELFTLSYAEAMLVQSAFFTAYLIVSVPAAALVRRLGYMRTAVA